MAPPRRHRSPPPLVCTLRASIDTSVTPEIDAVLKQLKACSRRLQAALACHRTELQVLERLYYKGKNQHRTALFWQRVAETRRLGERVDEMHLDDTVESLRLAFWGDPPSRTPKLLKGPWAHCPDAKTLLFVMERCSACCMLIDRARERLLHAYESFTLMMQTGAFLQLVLALAAIASRLSVLLSEVKGALELSWSASYRATLALFPSEAAKVTKLLHTKTVVPPQGSRSAPSASTPKSKSPAAVSGPADPQDEDLGSALARPVPQPPGPEENVQTFDADATATPHPRAAVEEEEELEPIPPPDRTMHMAYTLLDELAQPSESTRSNPAGGEPPAETVASAPKRKKRSEGEKEKPPKKKKKKRDEIDDIFGF
ncbi:hypothetical protein C8Q77DRAFT_1095741 [Trametes polyzona]|nr:hypothetical protein C8Q77DRAFT_1095741 [Trametes polyzona]